MESIGAFDAKTRLSELLERVARGEMFVITRHGHPIARLVPEHARDPERVARAVGSLLLAATTCAVALEVLATPVLIDLIAPGFTGEKREATIGMVRLLFPGIGFLVLSAWCLGILNSHRRFFLPYAAPVIWNGCAMPAMPPSARRRWSVSPTAWRSTSSVCPAHAR